MLLTRYLLREITASFFAITGVLLIIALSNQFVNYLAKSANGLLPLGLVLKIVGLYVPEFLCLLLPLGTFIGIVFCLSRLHSETEAMVMLTGGWNWLKFCQVAWLIALPVSLLTVALSTWSVPATIKLRENLLARGQASGVLHSITPGKFQSLDDGHLAFYVGEKSANTGLRQVFIASHPKPGERQVPVVTTAESADIQTLQDNRFYFVLKHGRRYHGVPGQAHFDVVNFAEYGREYALPVKPVPGFIRLHATSQLWQQQTPKAQAEWQWRLGLPIAVWVLATLAVPISHVAPRSGRYAKFLPAIVLFITYYNSLILGRRLIAKGAVPAALGLNLVHGVFICLALGMLYWVARPRAPQGWFKRGKA